MARTSSSAAVVCALCVAVLTLGCQSKTIQLLEEEASGGMPSGGARSGGNSNSGGTITSGGSPGSGGSFGGRSASGGDSGRGQGGMLTSGGRSQGTGGDSRGGGSGTDCKSLCPDAPCPKCDPNFPNCSFGDHCDPKCGVCIGCREDWECSNDGLVVCSGSHCVPRCGPGLPCPFNLPGCNKDGICTECTDKSHCATGDSDRVCDTDRNKCVQCTVDGDPTQCTNASCDTVRQRCVECGGPTANDDCLSGMCIKDKVYCACRDDPDCQISPFGTKCLMLPPGPPPRCGCNGPQDCPFGTECAVDHLCVPIP